MSQFDSNSLGKLLLLFAVIIAIVGFLLIALGKIPFFGKLPGDVAIRRGNSTFFFPIVTCSIVSIVLTILINLLVVGILRMIALRVNAVPRRLRSYFTIPLLTTSCFVRFARVVSKGAGAD